jgi:hypothetical protein
MPGWLGLAIVGGAAVVALGLAVAGLGKVAGAALKLKTRIENMQDLPIGATIERTFARLEIAQANVEQIPFLLQRARVALETLDETRRRVTDAAMTVDGMLGIAKYLFSPATKN